MVERQYQYVSNRSMKNQKGEETGRLQVLVKVNSTVADVKYKCPECVHEEQMQQEWKKPFNVKCSKCGNLMRLAKLLAQFKKEKKAEKEKLRGAVPEKGDD